MQPPPDWPKDQVDCHPLTVTMMDLDEVTPVIKSYWKPSEQELQWLNEGAAVVLFVAGSGMPPVALSVEVL